MRSTVNDSLEGDRQKVISVGDEMVLQKYFGTFHNPRISEIDLRSCIKSAGLSPWM